jgi:PPK2 family polyphosphate:nucleotide phosphotransferase
MKLKPVSSKKDIKLGDAHARWPDDGKSEKELERLGEKESARISELQRVFYADGRFAMLIVLQGRDASGKDGTIRKVFSSVNPQGCTVSSFKAPTELEQHHDFLWRIHQQIPARGMIGIFNRSHYEDILVPRVHDLVPKKVWSARYDQINAFEQEVAESGTTVIKVMTHISKDEQKARLMERLDRPDKYYKYNPGDVDERGHWDDYMEAYQAVLDRTTTAVAPWYVVPADRKWYARLAVQQLILDALRGMNLQWPLADFDVEVEKKRLSVS